ncbi:MAG: hypothetical protein O9295_00185 [Microcystis sp. LE18-22.4A]|nr:hypothetical protein [Microcystis sp. LE18-22.4A]
MRIQESVFRSQESGFRSQDSGVGSEDSVFRIQYSVFRRLFLFILPTSPRNAHAVTTPHPTPHTPHPTSLN